MNLEKFAERSRGFLQAAQTIAMRESHQRVLPDHLLKALMDDDQGLAANLIRTLNDVTGSTSLVISHDVPECMAISDHVVLLASQGRIVAQGTPAELMASTDPEVRQFVRGEPDGPVKFHYPARPMAEDFGVNAGSAT